MRLSSLPPRVRSLTLQSGAFNESLTLPNLKFSTLQLASPVYNLLAPAISSGCNLNVSLNSGCIIATCNCSWSNPMTCPNSWSTVLLKSIVLRGLPFCCKSPSNISRGMSSLTTISASIMASGPSCCSSYFNTVTAIVASLKVWPHKSVANLILLKPSALHDSRAIGTTARSKTVFSFHSWAALKKAEFHAIPELEIPGISAHIVAFAPIHLLPLNSYE